MVTRMLWKPKQYSFGMGSWTTMSLGVKCRMPCYFSLHNPLWSMCSNYHNELRWTWWKNKWSPLGLTRKIWRMHSHHQFNNLMAKPIRPHHNIPRGPSQKTKWFHIIFCSSGGWGGERQVLEIWCLIGKKIILIFLWPLPPTITPTNLVFITRFMVMVWAIVSHYIHSWNMANHKCQMPIQHHGG